MATSQSSSFEQVGSGLSLQARGIHTILLTALGATSTLTAAQSGSTVILDSATQTITLPAPVAGMRFTFRNTITSVAQKVITDSASTFLLGRLAAVSLVAGAGNAFDANGTTIRAIATNGTTTGGIVGDVYTLTALSSTQWFVEGTMAGSGTLATPFATS